MLYRFLYIDRFNEYYFYTNDGSYNWNMQGLNDIIDASKFLSQTLLVSIGSSKMFSGLKMLCGVQ